LFVAAVNNGKIFKITQELWELRKILFKQIKVYPNPASKRIFIDGVKDKNTTVEIISADGKKFYNLKVEKNKALIFQEFLPEFILSI
jgi:hypothetical protein